MPLKFWSKAFQTAILLINNLPTLLLKLKSPFEVLYNKKPKYHYLKSFGCAYYPYLRPYSFHKLDFHTSKCVFIGYSIYRKGYKCLHSTGRIYISKHVIFKEFDFPFQTLFPSSSTVKHSAPRLPVSVLHLISPLCNSSTPSTLLLTEHYITSAVHDIVIPNSPHSDPVPIASTVRDLPFLNWHISLPTDIACPTSQPDVAAVNFGACNVHPMITMSNIGVFKPKTYFAICQHPLSSGRN
ncbi:hypothetical protein ACOSP7_027335 [Xanthoceras sorbifolium]